MSVLQVLKCVKMCGCVSFDRVICIQVSPGALISPQHSYSDTGGRVEIVIDPAKMTTLPFSLSTSDNDDDEDGAMQGDPHVPITSFSKQFLI